MIGFSVRAASGMTVWRTLRTGTPRWGKLACPVRCCGGGGVGVLGCGAFRFLASCRHVAMRTPGCQIVGRLPHTSSY
eukprot:365511-Chlamydomonas_euryale.AAC.7